MSWIDPSDKIKNLPVYPFVKLERIKAEAKKQGKDLVDFGIGDPDLPTPEFILKAMAQAVRDPENHKYPTSAGMPSFREAASRFLERRFQIKMGPERIVSLIGSKEGLAHFPLGYLNPGDLALVPSPAYPVYKTSTLFAGGESYIFPLKEELGFLPDFEAIPKGLLSRAKILFLNYPNNPTGAVCDLAFLDQAVYYAKKYHFWVVQDAAYCEVCFDGYLAPSIFEVKGAEDCAIEFHSLSKTFNMTGWRLGFAAGAKDAIDTLAKVKSNIDSGVFQAVQHAGMVALDQGEQTILEMRKIYQRRRDLLAEALDSVGLKYLKPKATFYFWVKAPKGVSSEQMAGALLDQAGIIASPGSGYGPEGEGYVRFALVVKEDRIQEAAKRLKNLDL